jgi:hypothetical protein
MNLSHYVRPVVLALLAFSVTSATAAPVVLDFDSAATGANLPSAPLVTAAGTVTLSNGTSIFAGPTGNGLLHARTSSSPFARFDFSFDVTSITFDYNGAGTGAFKAEALDASGGVVASYSVDRTSCVPDACFDGLAIQLSALGIRAFQFQDWGLQGSFVDNVLLSTQPSPVPEPATIALVGLAFAGAGLARRRPVV